MFQQQILRRTKRYSRSLIASMNKIEYRNHNIISSFIHNPNKEDTTEIKGWVKNLRVMKGVVFADVSDGSCAERLQVVIPKELKNDSLGYGSSVHISGKLKNAPNGQLELMAEKVNVLGECVILDGYPFNPRTKHPPDYLRQYLHLRPRTNYMSSILRVRNAVTKHIHDYFYSRNYIHIHPPILTSNDCEGAGEIFKVVPENQKTIAAMRQEGQDSDSAYFGNKTFLSVSGQLHLEAMCRGMGNVYTLGPTFRAENSKSRLHLSEFYMLEAELAFCDKIEDLQRVIEDMMKYIFTYTRHTNESDLCIIDKGNSIAPTWLDKSFVTMTYNEAKSILERKGIASSEDGLNKEQELALVDHCDGVPVFVIRWPKQLKSFYMKESDTGEMVEALDLLTSITGEVVGGSLREDNYDVLKAKLPSDRLSWYLDLRKYGNIATGGFGLGLERLLQGLCRISNVKDTLPFPRWPHNCDM